MSEKRILFLEGDKVVQELDLDEIEGQIREFNIRYTKERRRDKNIRNWVRLLAVIVWAISMWGVCFWYDRTSSPVWFYVSVFSLVLNSSNLREAFRA